MNPAHTLIAVAAVSMSLLTSPLRAADAACAATPAEVEALRARVRTLEAALAGQTPAAAAAGATVLPGAAAKPPPTASVVVEAPYSRTGCSRGLFKGIASARWQDVDVWQDLRKGDTPAAVEARLGPEHFDEAGGGNVIWHYGRCGRDSMAQALFVNGRLDEWRPPSP